jgi:uncharacterized protein (TIGR02444 family)
MTKQSTSFWNFSNQLYARDGVAGACLHLQEQFHLDVNLVLFCFWSAQFETEVADDDWDKILAFSNRWKSQVVQPLRDVRTWMKVNSDNSADEKGVRFSTLRERIKMDELAAEKFQQDQIAELVPYLLSAEVNFNGEVAQSNFKKLLRAQSLEYVEDMDRQLDRIAQAINKSA